MKNLFVISLILLGLSISAAAQTRTRKKLKTGRAKAKTSVVQNPPAPAPVLGSGVGDTSGSGIGSANGSGVGNGTGNGVGTANGNGAGNGTGNGVGNYPATEKADLTPLMILEKPAPEMTEQMKQSGVSGVVRLRVTFLDSGQIGSVAVIIGLPGGFTESAIKAAKQIRFQPSRRNNQLVTTAKIVEYSFNQK